MEFEELLEEIKLNKYEQKAYKTLLEIGRCKSKSLCKESKVPYGRIYNILESLKEKGLISIYTTDPKTFEAIDPKISLKLILDKKSSKLMEMKQSLNTIKIPTKQIIEESEEKTIILEGKSKYIDMATELVNRANKEILNIPGIYDVTVVDKISYQKALKKGVKVKRLIREVTSQNRKVINENIKMGESVKITELIGLRLQIMDRKEAIIGIVNPRTKKRISIYVSNKNFANSMAIFFDSLWAKSKNLK